MKEQSLTLSANAIISILCEPFKHKAVAVIHSTDNDTFNFTYGNDSLLELVGCTMKKLLSTDPLSLIASSHHTQLLKNKSILARRQAFKTEASLFTANHQELQIDLELIPLQNPCEQYHLVLAEPICARKWIQQQLIRKQVIISGILSPDLVIELFEPYFDPILDEKIYYESLSAFDIISELDHPRIRQALTGSPDQELFKDLTLRTTRLNDVLEVDVRIKLRPFYSGSGRLMNYGFIVTELKPSEETDQPAVKLKIIMAQRSMSAQALAEATGITVQTISKLRNGKIAKPQRLTAQLIAAELGVPVTAIWNDAFRA